MESHKKLPLVYCLSVEMAAPASTTESSISKHNRLNVLLVEQLKSHLESLELDHVAVKFTGAGWLILSNSENDAPALCCLAKIISSTLKDEMAQAVGMLKERLPHLKVAIFSSRDRAIELPGGQKEWVGNSARKAIAMSAHCRSGEVLIDEAIGGRVADVFEVLPAEIAQRVSGSPEIIEEFAVSSLGEIKPEAASGQKSEIFIYALTTLGKQDAATAAARRLQEQFSEQANAVVGGVELSAELDLARMNRLIISILDYPHALQMLSNIKKAGLAANVITYNALIAKAPDYENARALFEMMLEDNIKADAATYSSLISKAPDYGIAKAIYEDMQNTGTRPSVVVYNTLVTKAPDYATAKAWVETMQEAGIQPSIVAYSSLVAKSTDFDRARFWLEIMLEEGIQPNLNAFNRLLSKAPDYDQAKMLLDMMQEEGIRSNIITYNSLITRAVDFETAVAWIDAMKTDGIQPNVDSFSRLFSKNLSGKKADELIAWYKAQGIESEEPIQAAISAFQKAGRIDEALRLAVDYPHLAVARKLIREIMDAVFAYLETMREEGVARSLESYNALIEKSPYYDTAKTWFDIMQKEGIKPDCTTYKLLVSKAPDFDSAKVWLEELQRDGLEPDAESYKALFSKNLSHKSADEIIRWYQAQSYHPDEPVQNAIATYRDINRVDQALRLALEYPHLQVSRKLIREHMAEVLEYLETVKEEGIKPNVVTYSTLISKAPYYNISESWLETMKNKGIKPNVVTYNALISKAPDYETGNTLLHAMEDEGVEPNVITYSSLISKAPDYLTAKSLFEDMKAVGLAPNVITYNSLLPKVPDYETAASLLEAMTLKGVEPNVITYNTLISKANGFHETKALIEAMQKEGIQPNIVSYNRLFSKDLSAVSADEIIGWYQMQSYHPDEPVQAAIAACRDGGRLGEALRLALEYPHLQVSRKLIREHMGEALSYFKRIHEATSQVDSHPNVDYALGVAFMESGSVQQAEPHLRRALERLKPGPRKVALEECLRRLDREMSNNMA